MEKAKEAGSNTALLFLGAAHFLWGGSFLGHVRSEERVWVKTASGRKRRNVLAVISYVSKKMKAVVNDAYITAEQVCGLLKMIAKTYKGKEIHIILAGARYQKCQAVTDLARKLIINTFRPAVLI